VDTSLISRVESLLRRAELLLSDPNQSSCSGQLDAVYTTICELVLDDHVVQTLWHEPILSQLNRLFGIKPPSAIAFGHLLDRLRQREQVVCRSNDLFFSILNKWTSPEEVYQALALVSSTDQSLLSRLIISGLLDKVRASNESPFGKVTAFLESLKDDLSLNLLENDSIKHCLLSFKQRESVGRVNALLVTPGHELSLLVPLELTLQTGNGQVRCTVPTDKEFDGALSRAQSALYQGGYLPKSFDVVCCLAETGSEYVGSSMALAAVAGMFGTGRQLAIDPYTAFSGDVVLEHGEWKVKSVQGLVQKISAARLNGCRRVFIPKENLCDLEATEHSDLVIIGIDNVLDILLELQFSPQPFREDSLHAKKINLLMAYCQASGWPLSGPRLIENGVQFLVVPLNLPEFPVTIYATGKHVPKDHSHADYQRLLEELAALDQKGIPIQAVNKTYKVEDKTLREKIRSSLDELQPQEKRNEPHCEYSFRFNNGQERLAIKQYANGKFQVQGSAGELFQTLLERIVPLYKLHYPNATLTVEGELAVVKNTGVPRTASTESSLGVPPIPLPHIGTDESGKGDYFGPMVVAGVLVDATTKETLESLGVKDSKLLSDKRCRELACQIRTICGARCEEVEISPDRYNKLYEEFRREGQNLNHLLAWGHARAIESLLDRFPCSHAVADQFGDEKYILSGLMKKGRQLNLKQITKGERYIAVAAASILARDKFLTRMDKLSQDYGVTIPKGASDSVVNVARDIVSQKGSEELKKVAKLHHKTTEKILKPNGESGHG
jgi:ribonuclease HIII